MATVAQSGQKQVKRANATDRTPVVFIHGLWLLASSWRPWMGLFEEAGFAPLASSWPGDPGTVEKALTNPQALVGPGGALGRADARVRQALRLRVP